MQVKRYFAKDMQEAMDTIIKELGSEAIVLSSRKTRKKGVSNLFKKPVLEVMVAYDPAQIPTAKKSNGSPKAFHSIYNNKANNSLPPQNNSYQKNAYQQNFAKSFQNAGYEEPPELPQIAPPAQIEESRAAEKKFEPLLIKSASPPVGELEQDQLERLSKLDSRLESLDNMLSEFMQKFSYIKRDVTYDFSEGVNKLFSGLLENQVQEEFAHSLAKDADLILKKKPETTALEVMEHLILEKLGSPDPIQTKKFQQKVILLIGPTGVGKTTSLVKLAANFSIKQKKKVGIINTDTYRIAAQEQLKTYADILSIPLNIVYKIDELSEIMETMADRDVIFIDTAGKRPGDEQHRLDITKIIEFTAPADVLLCIPVSISFEALKEVVDTYDFIDSFKLIITKLDETKYRGMILNLCWYANKPLAYVTTGQNVPDDIENIDVQYIVNNLLGKENDRNIL